MRAIQELVAKSRQAALERIDARAAELERIRQAKLREEAARCEQERRMALRRAIVEAINVGLRHEELAISLLAQADAELLVEQSPVDGANLLHEAASHGLGRLTVAILEIVSLADSTALASPAGAFFSAGADPEVLEQTLLPGLTTMRRACLPDYWGRTPLHRAAGSGSGKVCAEIAEICGAYLKATDKDGQTALEVARQWGFKESADAVFRAIHGLPKWTETVKPAEVVEPKKKKPKKKEEDTKKGGKRKGSTAPSKASPDASPQLKKRVPRKSAMSNADSEADNSLTGPNASPQIRKRVPRKSSVSIAESEAESCLTSPDASPQIRKRKPRKNSVSIADSEAEHDEASQRTSPASSPQSRGRMPKGMDDGSDSNPNSRNISRQTSHIEDSDASPKNCPEDSDEEGYESGLKQDLMCEEGEELSDEEEEDEEEHLADLGHEAGFHAVADGRFDDALRLARDGLWRFTNEKDSKGWTLLHHAAHLGLEEVVCAMLEREDFYGVDDGDLKALATPLHLAAASRRTSSCRAIVESGRCTKVNAGDFSGRTALHLAAIRSDLETFRAIVAHEDCDPTLPDRQGKSAADYARERGLDVNLPEALDIDL